MALAHPIEIQTEMINRYTRGESLNKIARKMNLMPSSVGKTIKRLGIPEPEIKIITKRKRRGKAAPRPSAPDNLIDNLMPTVSDDQLFYIIANKNEKRSVLSKVLNIPKFQLNFLLERLGSG
jgi:hypothetical protein